MKGSVHPPNLRGGRRSSLKQEEHGRAGTGQAGWRRAPPWREGELWELPTPACELGQSLRWDLSPARERDGKASAPVCGTSSSLLFVHTAT